MTRTLATLATTLACATHASMVSTDPITPQSAWANDGWCPEWLDEEPEVESTGGLMRVGVDVCDEDAVVMVARP